MEVVVVPSEGGRIASLRSLVSGLEFLTQTRPQREATSHGLQASFQLGPCAGAEECLPTVGACLDLAGNPAPDHGDFWQLPWEVDSSNDTQLAMHAAGFSRPLRFERIITINGASISLDYKVTNLGSKVTSFLYAWHPLFAVDTGDRVILPLEVNEIMLTYSRRGASGRGRRVVRWPHAEGDHDSRNLSVAGSADDGTAEMFYTRRLEVGGCGIFRVRHAQGLIVSFDTSQLPYLGVWLCFGGWPVEGSQPKQFAVALEPTTAPCNTLLNAEESGLAVNLASGESYSWKIAVGLTEPGWSYEDFERRLR